MIYYWDIFPLNSTMIGPSIVEWLTLVDPTRTLWNTEIVEHASSQTMKGFGMMKISRIFPKKTLLSIDEALVPMFELWLSEDTRERLSDRRTTREVMHTA